MGSTFSWLAFSEKERRKVLDVVELFGDRDTRDELGLGTVRDAFADLFFPGISTIQTRARYFLFVPWAYLDLERKKKPSKEIADLARWAEVKLINVLAETEGENEGVIGINARDTLKRLASNIYWQGLGLWRIRLFPGGQESYHRSLDRFYALTKPQHLSLEERQADAPAQTGNWHPALPAAPKDFPNGATFKLTHTEAHYLRERILTAVPDSLLAVFAKEPTDWDPATIELVHGAVQPTTLLGIVTTGLNMTGVLMDVGHVRHLRWNKDDKQAAWATYNRLRGQFASAMESAIPEQLFIDRNQCGRSCAEAHLDFSALKGIFRVKR